MRIQYKQAQKTRLSRGYTVYEFTITASITKAHFKELMSLARLYNAKTKTGFIIDADKDSFLALVENAEKPSAAVCRKSHAKSIENVKKRVACDHSDLGSLGFAHGSTVKCPHCGSLAQVW